LFSFASLRSAVVELNSAVGLPEVSGFPVFSNEEVPFFFPAAVFPFGSDRVAAFSSVIGLTGFSVGCALVAGLAWILAAAAAAAEVVDILLFSSHRLQEHC